MKNLDNYLNKFFINYIYKLEILLIFINLSSCNELIDCIASARPNLPSKDFIIGHLNSQYNESLRADVTNDPNDDGYLYQFYIDGKLPDGIFFNINDRTINFFGKPLQTGVYNFKIKLTIIPPESYIENGGFFEDGNKICFGDDTVFKSYSITIN